MGELERNKAGVEAFYDLMFNQYQTAEAIRGYVGDTYIQHNPRHLDLVRRKSIAKGDVGVAPLIAVWREAEKLSEDFPLE